MALFGAQYDCPLRHDLRRHDRLRLRLPVALPVLVFREAVVSGLTSGAVQG
ncbi:hypothetical protein [Streptomyces sp. NPDC018833]|uniref:hypothetical protein n=1 Tax=Streptomyces sp. NPDC018833 TaxID=3365053 RepID=UPI00379E087A